MEINEFMKKLSYPKEAVFNVIEKHIEETNPKLSSYLDEDSFEDDNDDGMMMPDFPIHWDEESIVKHYSYKQIIEWAIENFDDENKKVFEKIKL